MNEHLPFDNMIELRGSLIPSNAPNPLRLAANSRNRFSLQLDGDAPWGMRAALYLDDQVPSASPCSWNLFRPSGLSLASSMLASPPAFQNGVSLNPEILYKPNDTIQMEAGAGAASDGGFTFVFRGCKYLAPVAEKRPLAEEVAFIYTDEFTMPNGGVGGIPFQTLRRSIILDEDADFLLQTLAYEIDGGFNEVRILIWDPLYRALSNVHIPIQIAAGDWGQSTMVPRAFAPDVFYPASGTLTYEMTSWSPNELGATLDIRLAFGGVKRYRK